MDDGQDVFMKLECQRALGDRHNRFEEGYLLVTPICIMFDPKIRRDSSFEANTNFIQKDHEITVLLDDVVSIAFYEKMSQNERAFSLSPELLENQDVVPEIASAPSHEKIRALQSDNGSTEILGKKEMVPGAGTSRFKSFRSSLKDKASTLVQGTQNLGSSVIHGTHTLGNSVIQGTQNFGGSLIQGTQNIGSSVMQGTQNLGDTLKQGTQNFGGTLIQGTQAFGGSLIQGTQMVGTTLISGTQCVGGTLMQGTQAMGRTLSSSAKKIPQNLLNAQQTFDEFFEPSYPSTKFEELQEERKIKRENLLKELRQKTTDIREKAQIKNDVIRQFSDSSSFDSKSSEVDIRSPPATNCTFYVQIKVLGPKNLSPGSTSFSMDEIFWWFKSVDAQSSKIFDFLVKHWPSGWDSKQKSCPTDGSACDGAEKSGVVDVELRGSREHLIVAGTTLPFKRQQSLSDPEPNICKVWEILRVDEFVQKMDVAESEATDVFYLPSGWENSKLLNEQMVTQLVEILPARAQGYNWILMYSSEVHGFGLATLYRHMSDADDLSPSLLLVQDTVGQVFGAMVSCPLKLSDVFYGSGESALFTFSPRFAAFRWSGANRFVAKGDREGLGFGAGQGNFGLWLDDSLYRGRTVRCDTFKNESLVDQEDFLVACVEVFAFGIDDE